MFYGKAQDVALSKTVDLNLGGKLVNFMVECFIDICVDLLKILLLIKWLEGSWRS